MPSKLTPALLGAAAMLVALVVLSACNGAAGEARVVLHLDHWTLASASGSREVVVPAHFEHDLARSDTSYTLEAHVTLPSELRDRPLTLTIVEYPALARLRAGGHEAVDLRASPLDRYGTQGDHAWRITPDDAKDGALDLTLSAERTWFAADWLNSVPSLSATPAGDRAFVLVTDFNYITAEAGFAVTLLMASTYALLYALDRRRSYARWLAFQGLAGSLYPAFLLGIGQPLFGTWDMALASIGLSLSAVCGLHFLCDVAHLPPPTRAWWVAVLGTILAAVLRPDPRVGPSAPSVVAVLTLSLSAGYALAIMRRARLVATTRLVAIGFPLSVLVGLPDALVVLGGPDHFGGLRPGSLSFGILTFLQALYLGRDHDDSLRRADALGQELANRLNRLAGNNEEIQSLNEELRRQIRARSERLADAIARLGPIEATRRAFVAGDVVDERYRVVRVIGEGGMGTVYQIERLADGKTLALKVLHGARSGAELARLAREAEIASRVDHPNVVRIVDLDVARSGALFLVMDYIDGASLDERRERYADVHWGVSVLRQLAAGLAALHKEGIVHRDLKPANVLLAHDGARDVVKIADFGIAMRGTDTITVDQRVVTPETTVAPRDAVSTPDLGDAITLETLATLDKNGLTQTGQILGTPVYMAPELVHGAKLANAASDVYAFGIIAREVLTGKLPDGFDLLLHLRQRDVVVPPIASVLPGLSVDLAAILDACLARNPALRPSMDAVALALEAAGRTSAPSQRVPSHRVPTSEP